MSGLGDLARRLVALERAVASLGSSAQLAYSSIEDGAVQEYDADGVLAQRIGAQFDGTHVAASLSGPNPPAPSAPVVTQSIGGAKVRWDGDWSADAVAPMDFARVEIHVSTDPNLTGVTFGTLVGEVVAPRGGESAVVLPPGEHYVALVARSLSGKTSARSQVIGPVEVGFISVADPNTGGSLASISSGGSFAAQSLNVIGTNPDADGVPTQGLTVFGKEFATWLAERPKGMVARFFLTANRGNIGSTEYGIAEVAHSPPLNQASRMFKVTYDGYLRWGQAGTIQLFMRLTTDGTTPGVTSALFNSGAYYNGVAGISRVHLESYFNFTSTAEQPKLRALFTAKSISAGTINAEAGMTYATYLNIEDLGLFMPADDGVISGGAGSVESPPAAVQTTTTTWAATWSRSFRGDGTYGATSYAIQGYAPPPTGNQKAMIGFPTFTAAIGKQIKSVEVYLNAFYWGQDTGGTAVIGVHGAAAIPATYSSSGQHLSEGWPKPGARWVTLPSALWPAFGNGGNKGITLGPGLTTSSLYYGQFTGAAGDTDGNFKPLVRITYL